MCGPTGELCPGLLGAHRLARLQPWPAHPSSLWATQRFSPGPQPPLRLAPWEHRAVGLWRRGITPPPPWWGALQALLPGVWTPVDSSVCSPGLAPRPLQHLALDWSLEAPPGQFLGHSPYLGCPSLGQMPFQMFTHDSPRCLGSSCGQLPQAYPQDPNWAFREGHPCLTSTKSSPRAMPALLGPHPAPCPRCPAQILGKAPPFLTGPGPQGSPQPPAKDNSRLALYNTLGHTKQDTTIPPSAPA